MQAVNTDFGLGPTQLNPHHPRKPLVTPYRLGCPGAYGRTDVQLGANRSPTTTPATRVLGVPRHFALRVAQLW